MDDALKVFLPMLATIVFGIISYLLSKTDKAQEQQIAALKDMIEKQRDVNALLFKKHDDDAAALGELRLSIAKEHYLKHELDSRFLSLEATFKEGMGNLATEIKNLTQIMLAHLERDRMK